MGIQIINGKIVRAESGGGSSVPASGVSRRGSSAAATSVKRGAHPLGFAVSLARDGGLQRSGGRGGDRGRGRGGGRGRGRGSGRGGRGGRDGGRRGGGVSGRGGRTRGSARGAGRQLPDPAARVGATQGSAAVAIRGALASVDPVRLQTLSRERRAPTDRERRPITSGYGAGAAARRGPDGGTGIEVRMLRRRGHRQWLPVRRAPPDWLPVKSEPTRGELATIAWVHVDVGNVCRLRRGGDADAGTTKRSMSDVLDDVSTEDNAMRMEDTATGMEEDTHMEDAHIEDTGTDTEDTHDVAEQAAAKRSRGSSRGESDVLDEIFGSDEDDNDSDDDDDVIEEEGDTA